MNVTREGTLGTLYPLEVPWQISPSTPFLRLRASENPQDDPLQIILVAHFALEGKSDFKPSEDMPERVNKPKDIVDAECSNSDVKITFTLGVMCRLIPSYSDSEVIQENAYDWSQVKYAWDGKQDIDEWLNSFKRKWSETEICPDPQIYQVENSAWLQEKGMEEYKSGDWKHYLILGHDAYAEIIAKDLSWERI